MAFFIAAAVLITVLFCVTAGIPVSSSGDHQTNGIIADKLDGKAKGSTRVEEDLSWPDFSHLGQACAVSLDGDGNLHILHRADRIFQFPPPNDGYPFNKHDKGLIPNDTVIVVDSDNGKILYSWGANLFYKPHGMVIDSSGNSWVTDVDLHQVFKFPANVTKPEIVIGKAFTPGAGRDLLCGPSDVAVSSTGNFFISDGYCNSRIVMFSSSGDFIKEFGSTDGLHVPHALTIIPEHDELCLADRGNRRILCYASDTSDTETGSLLGSLDARAKVYALHTRGTQLFAINGPDKWIYNPDRLPNRGLIFDTNSRIPLTVWGPEEGFRRAHDLVISPDGKYVYVSLIDVSAPRRIHKFNIIDK